MWIKLPGEAGMIENRAEGGGALFKCCRFTAVHEICALEQKPQPRIGCSRHWESRKKPKAEDGDPWNDGLHAGMTIPPSVDKNRPARKVW